METSSEPLVHVPELIDGVPGEAVGHHRQNQGYDAHRYGWPTEIWRRFRKIFGIKINFNIHSFLNYVNELQRWHGEGFDFVLIVKLKKMQRNQRQLKKVTTECDNMTTTMMMVMMLMMMMMSTTMTTMTVIVYAVIVMMMSALVPQKQLKRTSIIPEILESRR